MVHKHGIKDKSNESGGDLVKDNFIVLTCMVTPKPWIETDGMREFIPRKDFAGGL